MKDWLEKSWVYYFDDIEVLENLTKLHLIIIAYKDSDETDIQVGLLKIAIETFLLCKKNVYTGALINPNYEPCYSQAGDILNNIIQLWNTNKITINNFCEIIKPELFENYKILDKFFTKISNDRVLNTSFFRGPPVNFTILEELSAHAEVVGTIEEFDKFYQHVIPYCIGKNIINQNSKIACVSHGGILREYFTHKYRPEPMAKLEKVANTQVLEEKIRINGTHLQFIDKKYEPDKIRTKYKNFEVFNMNPCLSESVKGVINFPLWDIAKERGMIPLKKTLQAKLWYKPVDYATPDVAFALAKKYTGVKGSVAEADIPYYDQRYQVDQIAGMSSKYTSKYIKYKTKYENLKKKMKYKNIGNNI